MSSRSINRKDFLVITVSAVTASVLAAACGGDDTPAPSGTAGTTGTAGSGAGGTGTAGTGTAGTGTAGTGTAGTGTAGTGTGGASGGSGGAAGGTGGASGGTGGASGGTGGASGGSGGSGGGGGGGKCGADLMITSTGDHTHTLVITAAQFTAGAEVTIQTGGSNGDANGHKHWVKITAADFTALQAGTEVKKKSCSGGNHEYVLKCGGGASAGTIPDATACPDANMCGSAMGDAC